MKDIEQLTDSEINKLMNDHDDGLCPRPYATCIDAAVGWIERRGLYWSRYQGDNNPSVAVSGGLGQRPCNWKTCPESPTCQTARALCNAGLAAWRKMGQAKEAKK